MMAKDRAYTLIELVISFALLTMILLSFYPIIITNNNINTKAEKNLEAQIIAQNEIETIIPQASNMSSQEFIRDLEKYERDLNQKYLGQNVSFQIYFQNENRDKSSSIKNRSLKFKLSFDNALIYETETWLHYDK